MTNATLETKLKEQATGFNEELLQWRAKHEDLLQRFRDMEALKLQLEQQSSGSSEDHSVMIAKLESELVSKSTEVSSLQAAIAEDEHVVDQWRGKMLRYFVAF